MAFFDELTKKAQTYAGVAVDKAKDLAGAASEKAKEVADSAKINMAILSEQRELDKNYKAIGEWFVAEYGEDIPDAVKDVVEAVNASRPRSPSWRPPSPRRTRRKSPPSIPALSAAPPPTASSAPSAAPPWARPRIPRSNEPRNQKGRRIAPPFLKRKTVGEIRAVARPRKTNAP